MKKIRDFLNKKRKGMTLIELMIVVVIIGIVFAYAFVNAGANTEKAKYARCEEDLSALSSAYAMVVAENGVVAVFDDAKLKDGMSAKIDNKLSKPVAQMIDPWGTAYDITITGGNKVVFKASKETNPYSTPANLDIGRTLDFSE